MKIACQRVRPAQVRRLARAGAALSGVDGSPIFGACAAGRVETALALLEAGAPPAAPRGDSLVLAARRARQFELADGRTLKPAWPLGWYLNSRRAVGL